MGIDYNLSAKRQNPYYLKFSKKSLEAGYMTLDHKIDDWHHNETEKIIIPKDRPMCFVFYEVGCRMSGKPSQLEESRFRFYRTWSEVVKPYGYPMPLVIRVLAHYDKYSGDFLVGRRAYGLDIDVHYGSFPDSVISNLPPYVIDYIRQNLKGKAGAGLWERIVRESNGDLLNFIMVQARRDKGLGLFRGLIAEALAQYDASIAAPNELTIRRNVVTKLKSKDNFEAVEFDMMGFTQNPSAVMGFAVNLEQMLNAEVTHRYH